MKRCLVPLAAWLLIASLALAAPASRDPALTITEVTAGLSAPTTMAFIGAQNILVLQKGDGRVLRVISGVLQAGAVLDVAVDRASERGLLGIAVILTFLPPHSFTSTLRRAGRPATLPVLLLRIACIVILGMARY